MTSRREQILDKIIMNYIARAEPVVSADLAKFFDLSSATIRNEMAAIEKDGFIHQPYTSAGRVPTEKGYQYYISHSLKPVDISKSHKQNIDKVLENKDGDFSVLAKKIARTMSDISSETVLVSIRTGDIFYTGISYLFAKPEFMDPKLVKNLSCLLDSLDARVERIFDVIGRDVEIFVGRENPFTDSCSALITRYKMNGKDKSIEGVLGILGPMRMPYEDHISLLEYCRDSLETFRN